MKTSILKSKIKNQPLTNNMFYGLFDEKRRQHLLAEIENYEEKYLDFIPSSYEEFAEIMENKMGPVDGLEAGLEEQSYSVMETLVNKYGN